MQFADQTRVKSLVQTERDFEIYKRIPQDALFVQDLNGDGIPDLIVKYSTEFLVWYGKGNFEFEDQFQALRFSILQGSLSLWDPGYQFDFQDLNGDGIADLVLFGKNELRTFFFDGNNFFFWLTLDRYVLLSAIWP